MLKGFPNQINDLAKLARAMGVARALRGEGAQIRDDGVFGEALVRAGVLGTGHSPRPVEEYLAEQRLKPHSNQSFRTSARGLRELFRLMNCLAEDPNTNEAWLTPLGSRLARDSTEPLDEVEKAQWRAAVAAIKVGDPERGISHPYQVLIRLVQRHPDGLPRSKCALCLEANDDSDVELDRIVELASFDDDMDIWRHIGGDPNQRANWDNAVKVLPAFAEQLGDIVKSGRLVRPSPDSQWERPASNDLEPVPAVGTSAAEPIRANARVVDASRIARAGTTSDESDPISSARTPTREELAATLTARAERLTRHNLLVQQLARRLEANGCALSEDPYDCLASRGDQWVLIEVKTLHPRGDDERSRIRDALAQLLYYKQFALPDDCQDVTMTAVFERKPLDQHIEWLRNHSICAVWALGDRFIASDVGACGLLSEFAEPHGG